MGLQCLCKLLMAGVVFDESKQMITHVKSSHVVATTLQSLDKNAHKKRVSPSEIRRTHPLETLVAITDSGLPIREEKGSVALSILRVKC